MAGNKKGYILPELAAALAKQLTNFGLECTAEDVSSQLQLDPDRRNIIGNMAADILRQNDVPLASEPIAPES